MKHVKSKPKAEMLQWTLENSTFEFVGIQSMGVFFLGSVTALWVGASRA
jgi:hypothetical protein